MKKTLVIGGIAATAVLVAGWALAQSPGYGPGGFGPGFGPRFSQEGGPYGMGPGMMRDRGGGWGPGYRQDEGRGWGPGMGPMHRMGRGMMGGGPGSFLDTERLDAMKRDLAVTPAQEAVWIKYSKAVQDAAAAAKETRSSVDTDAVAKMSRAERYDFFAKLHEQRWQQHQAVRTAARELFATLDEKEKDVAEDTLPGLGGFGPRAGFGPGGGFGPGMMHGGRSGGPGWR
jgi:hypothetical protein